MSADKQQTGNRQQREDLKQKRRMAYSLAAGAAGACVATEADAQPCPQQQGAPTFCYREFDSDLVVDPGNFLNLYIDFDPYYDIRLENYNFINGPYQGAYVLYSTAGPNGGEAGRVVGFSANGLAYARALRVGDLIDASTTADAVYDVSLAYGASNPNAEFNDVQNAFIGVGFPIFDSIHYGWVRVSINNTAQTLTIHDVAFDFEPEKQVLAGQVAELSAGDYNDDGVVDAIDYVIFRETQGSVVDLRADGDGNNEVGPGDYIVWSDEFGYTALGDFVTVINPLPSTAIPEPATLGLLAAGAGGLAALRRARGDSKSPGGRRSS